MQKLEIKVSKDGSKTLFVPHLNEHYHSTNGALTEAVHVYLHEGLTYFSLNHPQCSQINILEVGFGTGLNALVTATASIGKRLVYDALEKFPVPSEVVEALNYRQLNVDNGDLIYNQIHLAAWNKSVLIHPNFVLEKIVCDLTLWVPNKTYDVVFFDAFAPDVQPEMWDVDIFKKIGANVVSGGVLTTYCAKGEVRRRLQQAGFKVFRIPGPPGKREMIRAVKI